MSKNTKVPKIPSLPYGEGSMSIKERPDGSYYVMYRKSFNGKRLTTYGDTASEAMTSMRKKEKEEETKFIQSTVSITLEEDVKNWLEYVKAPTLKPKSYDRIEMTYNNQIKGYVLASLRISVITDNDIQNHINELVKKNLSHSTIKKAYDLLNEYFRYKYIRSNPHLNPMLTVTMPNKDRLKPIKELEWLSQDEIEIFTEQATMFMKHKNKPKYTLGHAFVALIYMGLRAGEFIALRWKHVDFDNNVIYIRKSIERVINREYDEKNPELMKQRGITKYIDVEGSTKTHETRTIPMTPIIKKMLSTVYKYSEYQGLNDYVIAVKEGGCNNITNMSRCLGSIYKDAGIDKHSNGIHVLRHTCASLYFRNKVALPLIAAHLGNSVEVCQKTYIHFIEQQQAEVARKVMS